MKQFFKRLMGASVILFIIISGVYAQSQDPITIFYGGLADIIQENMNSPQRCVSQAESFIDANIAPLLRAMRQGMQTSQGRDYEQMDESQSRAALEQMGQSMSKSGGMQAMNRYVEAITDFGDKHPDYAKQIMIKLNNHSQDQFQGFKDY